MSFTENLNAYISNPKNRHKPISVGDTPNALLAIGAKQLPVVINIREVKKCIDVMESSKNQNSHEFTKEEFSALPELLANPVMIFTKDENNKTIITDKLDKHGKIVVIGVELNRAQDEYTVNRITTMHGRDNMTDKFIAKNGEEVEGFIPRNIADGNLLAININKAPEFLRPARLQLPEGGKFVSFDNSITHSLKSVKCFGKNIFNRGEIMENEVNFWREKVGQEFPLRGGVGGNYTVLDVIDNEMLTLRRDDGYRLDVHLPQLNDDGTIEWAYSTQGYFENVANLKTQSTTSETAMEINQKNKEENQMQENYEATKGKETTITARVTPIENESKLKGIGTVIIGDQIAVHGVKIVDGEKGLFLSMPGQKGANGKFNESAIPANKEAFAQLKETVFKAYEDALTYGKQQKSDLSPTNVSVKASNFRENNYDNNIKGDCSITVNDIFVIKGVKLIETKNKELSIAMPSKQDEYGEYISVVTPMSKDFFAQVKAAVIDCYNNPPKTIGNATYGQLDAQKEFKTYYAKFAEKIGAQLTADGVKWSGKIEGEKAKIAVSKADASKLEKAVEKAKDAGAKEKNEAKQQSKENPVKAPKFKRK